MLLRLLPFFITLLVLVSGCADGKEDTGLEATTSAALKVHPPQGGRDTTMVVSVEASSSAFDFEDTTVNFGDGIEVDEVLVLDGWSLEAAITIAEDASLGARDVTVNTRGTRRTLTDGFRVVSESFTVEPGTGMLGETVDVVLEGRNTSWEHGKTWPTFGEGVTILSFSVITSSIAEARLSIRADTWAGPRDVLVETGTHVDALYSGFLVDRVGIAASFDPSVAEQGETVTFTIEARGTSFVDGETTIEFFKNNDKKADIVVDRITVLDATNLYGQMTLSNAAEIGFRDVLVTVPDSGVMIPQAFEVTDGPLDLTKVAVYLQLQVLRTIDNSTGAIWEMATAFAMFYIPLDPPCGGGGAMGSGPQPYDVNGVFPYPESSDTEEDCPSPRTLGAGDYVWFESEANTITLQRYEDPGSGLIYYYDPDFTSADYAFGYWYDLHTQGEEGGIGEYLLEKVQPTVPGDFTLLSPELWGDYTHSRAEDFHYTWTPAQTYPDAIFSTGISGTLESTGKGGFVGCVPWDDGDHTYLASELSQLAAGPVDYYAYSYIEGPTFGLPDSIYQSNPTESLLYLGAYMILE